MLELDEKRPPPPQQWGRTRIRRKRRLIAHRHMNNRVLTLFRIPKHQGTSRRPGTRGSDLEGQPPLLRRGAQGTCSCLLPLGILMFSCGGSKHQVAEWLKTSVCRVVKYTRLLYRPSRLCQDACGAVVQRGLRLTSSNKAGVFLAKPDPLQAVREECHQRRAGAAVGNRMSPRKAVTFPTPGRSFATEHPLVFTRTVSWVNLK